MKISNNTAALVSYSINSDSKSGELIEFVDAKSPKLLVFGNGVLIPGFETKMANMEPGESFEFTLSAEESFGNYRDDLVVNVPKSSFEINGVLKEDLIYLGNEISMMDNSGNTVLGRILEIDSNNVRMDFNHKLAGKSLFVVGQIHEVRQVTDDDLAPSGGCGSGCGCGSNNNESTSCCSTETVDSYDDDCPTCGNPAELRGSGKGNCGCS